MKMSKKTLGLILLLFPWVLLPLVLSAYAISSFLIMASAASESNLVGVGNFIRILLGFLGIVEVLGFLVGTPLGIFFLTRKEPGRFEILKLNPRFQALTDDELHTIGRWSWGAFFNTLIWALGNRLWLWALGTLIPLWNLYVWIRLSMDGRQIVWERSQLTLHQFQRRQKIIAWVIGIVTVLAIPFSSSVSRFFSSSSVSDSTLTTTALTSGEAVRVSKLDTTVRGEGSVQEVSPAASDSADYFLSQGTTYSCDLYRDTDGDRLSDMDERNLKTDPNSKDTDFDGYEDFEELLSGFSPNNSQEYDDMDGDGLADTWEVYFYHSREATLDSDGDGVSDFEEVKRGKDPNGSGELAWIGSDIGASFQLIGAAQKQCNFE